MDLARALTNRHRRQAVDNAAYLGPARATSMRNAPIKRSAISNPVQLISTTNVLALQAPNIHNSDNDSDTSSPSLGSSSRATTPDMSPAEDSPTECLPHPSFMSSTHVAPSSRISKDSTDSETSPRIPQRAFSHTKQTHQAVAARNRSDYTSVPPPNAIHNPPSPLRDTFSTKPASNHPFGAELAQVNEIAETFNATKVIILDEEEQLLQNRGLYNFGAEEYVDEIQGLFGGIYNNPFSSFTPAWI